MATCACGNRWRSWNISLKSFPTTDYGPTTPRREHIRAPFASEMHAGFTGLRRHLPMNVARPVKFRPLDADAAKDVARIDAIWRECRAKYGAGDAFLFGAFGAVDAMFAPVVWRFHTYAVEVSTIARDYMRAMMALPAWTEWRDAARRETWILAEDEVDWPQVLR